MVIGNQLLLVLVLVVSWVWAWAWGLVPLVALVVSTLVVFVLTWLLHAVQWFWLRGSFLWAANDVLATLNERKLAIADFPISAGRLAGLVTEIKKAGLNKQRAREVYGAAPRGDG